MAKINVIQEIYRVWKICTVTNSTDILTRSLAINVFAQMIICVQWSNEQDCPNQNLYQNVAFKHSSEQIDY